MHSANYGHTDVRWENIIQCGSEYRLIDLEFACKLKQLPYTPKGQQIVLTILRACPTHIMLFCHTLTRATCACSFEKLSCACCLSNWHLLGKDHKSISLGAGHERKARPELYVRKWTVQHDLVLVGDLLQSCGILDLDAQGQDLMKAMQAGELTTSMALQHPWLA